jgi:hypothetical protein
MPDTINIFVSSEAATEVTTNNSTIHLNFSNPIDTKNKKCRVLSSSVWYTMPNIIEGINNEMNFTYDSTDYNLTFGTGLYSVTDLNERITELLMFLGLDTNLFKFIPDESTGKITLMFNIAGATFAIDFDTNNALCKDILGFAGSHSLLVVSGYSLESTNKAELNVINNLYIWSDFTGSNTIFNSVRGSGIIASVPINGEPGSLLYREAIHPIESDILPYKLERATFYLTDQNGTKVNMNGEHWYFELQIF